MLRRPPPIIETAEPIPTSDEVIDVKLDEIFTEQLDNLIKNLEDKMSTDGYNPSPYERSQDEANLE